MSELSARPLALRLKEEKQASFAASKNRDGEENGSFLRAREGMQPYQHPEEPTEAHSQVWASEQ